MLLNRVHSHFLTGFDSELRMQLLLSSPLKSSHLFCGRAYSVRSNFHHLTRNVIENPGISDLGGTYQ